MPKNEVTKYIHIFLEVVDVAIIYIAFSNSMVLGHLRDKGNHLVDAKDHMGKDHMTMAKTTWSWQKTT